MLYYSNQHVDGNTTPVRDIMERNLTTVSPQTKTSDAIELLKSTHLGCLPVVHGNKLAGLVTERDFMKLAAELLKEIA
jgi:IMP dehydrogenase